MNASSAVDRVYDSVPDLICGVGLIAFGAVGSRCLTAKEVSAGVKFCGGLLAELKAPDLALGCVLAILNIALPYGVALVLNPLSQILANIAAPLFTPKKPSYTGTSHTAALDGRAASMFGVPLPAGASDVMLLRFLEHVNSPVAGRLRAEARGIYVQVRVALPTSIIAAVIARAAIDEPSKAMSVTFIVGILTFAVAMYAANSKWYGWSAHVEFAYLTVTGPGVLKHVADQSGKRQTAA